MTDLPESYLPQMSSGIESAPGTVASGASFTVLVFATDQDTYHWWYDCGHDESKVLASGVHYVAVREIRSGVPAFGGQMVLYQQLANGKRVYQIGIDAHPNTTEETIWYVDEYNALDDQNPHDILIDSDTHIPQVVSTIIGVLPDDN